MNFLEYNKIIRELGRQFKLNSMAVLVREDEPRNIPYELLYDRVVRLRVLKNFKSPRHRNYIVACFIAGAMLTPNQRLPSHTTYVSGASESKSFSVDLGNLQDLENEWIKLGLVLLGKKSPSRVSVLSLKA